ncbi:MAG: endonuclease/exonuclease/phosphatase family protein [Cyclobacteriaceae bacterium]
MSESEGRTTTQLKIAAYNVEFGDKGSAQEIGELLASHDFDVVCMSEVPGGDWAEKVGEAMGLEHVVLGKYSTAGHEDKYKAILSKTLLYDQEEVLMADSLHTAVKAKTKLDGREISLYSVHFPFGWRDQAHIDETTNKIQTFVNYLQEHQSEEMAVIAGDFNFIPSSQDTLVQYYEMFTNLGYRLSGQQVGMDYESSDTMVRETPRPGRVIDHIFFNPDAMIAQQAGILELDKPLSDHKPVWALLEIIGE